ncbi:MAG: flagellar export chaperone FliS [Oscillospiraceae bacterium]|jgi:flagellar protein FliS|nr:flagellar export chaperone FliS [Oscillospiraceae bacterium]
MQRNPYQAYQQQSVMTMTQGEMLLKLYDETIKQLSAAEIFMGEGSIEKTNQALQKAQKIVNHLRATLDFQYEISNQLAALYDYFVRQIVAANIKKDVALIQEVLPMVTELRDTFAQAAKQSHV